MATVKAMLPLVAEDRLPGETLTELNRRLYGELPRHAFVALAYARFDPQAGTIELSNAGLPDQYLLRAGAALLQLVNDAARADADVLDSLFGQVRRITSDKLEDDCTALVLYAQPVRA